LTCTNCSKYWPRNRATLGGGAGPLPGGCRRGKGLPCALLWRLWDGNNDTVGAASAVDKLATGLQLTKAAATLDVTGAVTSTMHEQAYELGGTLAALLME
jgi:hypothetical protein